ncbi:Retrovirus-related Pol polyprotein from transposon RE2 [Vitis vinifera]|uniref:Retrovirus-related Pol polyprotein from transposon RE2 n=1 Tax=Vitis vinifera TaxID=29760 RepID=A0A438JQT7_VITVI|nr:Retrovirus-related Pol polyprotein from transposon RE2 [Vitis vinifera]
MSPKQSLFYPTWYYTCNAKQGENHSIILELKHNVEECDLRTLSLPYKESNGSPKTILLFAIAVYSIPANRPVTVFHSGPLIPSRTTPDNLIAVGSLPRRQPFRRIFPATSFPGTDHIFRTAEADLHASGNPTGNRSLTCPHAPIFPVGLSPTRRRVTARGSLSGHVRHLSRLVRRRLGFLALRQSSPSPASPLFFLFLAFLPFRPHLTGLPLHLRGLEKLVGSENYLSWSASVELWFMGQGYEDHLVTQEADIPEVDRVQWRKIDAQLSQRLYMNDIQRLYKVASAIVHLSQQDLDLSTYIGLTSSSWSLLLLASRPDLEPIRDQILGSSSVPSLDDVFARLLRLSSTQTLPSDSASDSSVLVSQTTSRGGRSLQGRPPRTAHMAQSSDSPLPQPPSSSASQTSQASIASVAQPGNASACLTHTSSLGPWILDSGASDHLSGIGLALPLPSLPLTSVLYTPECPFNLISISKITRTLNCSITFSDKFVTLQDRSTGKTIGIGRESQGLYHLTSDSSPAVCISTDAPLLIHNRLGHPSLSKFQKMVSSFFHFVVASVDNAREYFSAQFTSFMSHHGILHQSSCAHTPQQNGVAERKNRHLVETARTLLLHSHIPHSLLFPDQPLYFLPPRVFGCTCFVHILTPGQDKLSAKAMKTHHSFPHTSESLPVSEVLPIPIVSPPEAMPPRPLQVYHRRPRIVAPLPSPEAPADSLPIPSASPAPALPSPNDLPIAVRKGWRQAMVDEMAALHSNGTWDLVVLPLARLVAKGYTQVYGSDYGDTFSLLPRIASVRLLLSMAAMCSWPLYQLDIKNAFLHGDLAEEVYMEQPPGFVAQGESGLVCRLRRSLYGLKQSPRAWFSRFSSVVQEFGMLRSSDQDGIQKLKQHLFTHFQTKDLGKLKYFLGIEIAQSSSGVVLSQRKYALDILEETGMLDCKPVDTPMDPNVKLVPGQGEPLGDPGRYRRLVGKLNYLTITRPDISFPVSVVSQFLQSPCDSHWDAVIRILRYIKSTPGQGVLYENRGYTQVVGYTDADWAGSPTDRRSTSGYCVFIGGNLISWKSKKQDVVARSSAEAEYRAMALATCELIWLRHLLQELRFGKDEQMKLICDNQAALHIASNPVFHERTKHIEVDCHFIREKIASGCVATKFCQFK